MFAFPRPVGINIALDMLRIHTDSVFQDPADLVRGKTTNKLALTTPTLLDPASTYGYGKAIFDNSYNVLGVGSGYINEPATVAKALKLMVADFNTLALLPALLVRAKYDMFVFRELLQEHIDGDFCATLWYQNKYLTVTTRSLASGRFRGHNVLGQIANNSEFDIVKEISPYTIQSNDMTISWQRMSRKPLYIVSEQSHVKNALAHSRFYVHGNFGFFVPYQLAKDPKKRKIDTDALVEHGAVITAARSEANELAQATMCLDIATEHGYDAIVFPTRRNKFVLQHLTDAVRNDGNRKYFSFLDYTTHALP